MSTEFTYDLFVIGAGSGGVRAARIAAQHGAKVAICESDRVGGTCVIRGCVPKKLMVYASHYKKMFRAAQAFGWSVESHFDWPTLMSNKNKEIDRLNDLYKKNLNKAGVSIIKGHGTFVDSHTIDVNGDEYTAKHILIATGSRPKLPDLPGISHAITSDEALELEKLPKTITIYGAGYVGVEFACIFNALGAEVNLVYHSDLILSGFDKGLREAAHNAYKNSGINILTNTQINAIEKTEEGYVCKTNQDDIVSDLVMFATGRSPNIDNLNLQAVDIQSNKSGHIDVDDKQHTGRAHIYALGDITNSYKLTPVAIREGHLLADRLFNQSDELVQYDHISTVVFGQPEIASCGLTEENARDQYKEIYCLSSSFRAMKYAMTDIDEKTHMKLIFDKTDDKLIGCHILGVDASEMIQGFAVAMKKGVSLSDLHKTMAIHPTSAEELVTMR